MQKVEPIYEDEDEQMISPPKIAGLGKTLPDEPLRLVMKRESSVQMENLMRSTLNSIDKVN